jgi:hypothetical protein
MRAYKNSACTPTIPRYGTTEDGSGELVPLPYMTGFLLSTAVEFDSIGIAYAPPAFPENQQYSADPGLAGCYCHYRVIRRNCIRKRLRCVNVVKVI